jgi:hypothetical protein
MHKISIHIIKRYFLPVYYNNKFLLPYLIANLKMFMHLPWYSGKQSLCIRLLHSIHLLRLIFFCIAHNGLEFTKTRDSRDSHINKHTNRPPFQVPLLAEKKKIIYWMLLSWSCSNRSKDFYFAWNFATVLRMTLKKPE